MSINADQDGDVDAKPSDLKGVRRSPSKGPPSSGWSVGQPSFDKSRRNVGVSRHSRKTDGRAQMLDGRALPGWNCKPRSRFEEPDADVRDGSNPPASQPPRKSGAAIPRPLSCRQSTCPTDHHRRNPVFLTTTRATRRPCG